jgi:hypothetical protein
MQWIGRRREALLDQKTGCVTETRSRRAGGTLPERGASGSAP